MIPILDISLRISIDMEPESIFDKVLFKFSNKLKTLKVKHMSNLCAGQVTFET